MGIEVQTDNRVYSQIRVTTWVEKPKSDEKQQQIERGWGGRLTKLLTRPGKVCLGGLVAGAAADLHLSQPSNPQAIRGAPNRERTVGIAIGNNHWWGELFFSSVARTKLTAMNRAMKQTVRFRAGQAFLTTSLKQVEVASGG